MRNASIDVAAATGAGVTVCGTRGSPGATPDWWRRAFLVNTSRGPIVDTDALLAALHAGNIAGAAVDVYDEEPLPMGHPLRSAPRTAPTPHLGYVTDDGYRMFYGDAVEDIAAFASGRPVRGLELLGLRTQPGT
jgi:phosphoglycerate dehydrogenase-like enzyme